MDAELAHVLEGAVFDDPARRGTDRRRSQARQRAGGVPRRCRPDLVDDAALERGLEVGAHAEELRIELPAIVDVPEALVRELVATGQRELSVVVREQVEAGGGGCVDAGAGRGAQCGDDGLTHGSGRGRQAEAIAIIGERARTTLVVGRESHVAEDARRVACAIGSSCIGAITGAGVRDDARVAAWAAPTS